MGIFNLFKKKELTAPLFPSVQRYNSTVGITQNQIGFYRGWAFVCISAIKDEIASIDLALYKHDKNGNKERIYNHPAIDLLYFVNNFYTKFTLFEQLQADLELQGNHYWFIDRDGKGQPVAIYPLNPVYTKPIVSQTEYVDGYMYTIDGQQFKIDKDSVIHFKTFNPSSPIIGLSTIESVRVSLETDEAAKAYNKQFFENSATPGIILEYPGQINSDTMERLKAQWDNEYRGFKKAYRTAVAAGGLKIHQMEFKQTDMQFMEQRKFSRDEILALFRVPPTIAGIVEATVYASAKAAEYVFARRTIEPKMRRIIDTLNEFYLPLFENEGLEFDFISPVPKDMVEQTAYYQSGLNNGYLSPNDIRRMEGLPELEDGENLYLPMSLSPYTKPVEQKKENPKAEAKAVLQKSFIESAAKSIAKTVADAQALIANQWTPKEFDELGETKGKRRNSRTTPFEKKFAETSIKLFDGQKQRAIDSINASKSFIERSKKNKSVIKKSLLEPLEFERELKITMDLFGPLFIELTGLEGEAALEALGLDPREFDVESPNIRKEIQRMIKKFAGTVTETTTSDIKKILSEGLDAGLAIPDLTTLVSEYSGFDKARAEVIARSEVLRSQGNAELIAWKESDVVMSKVWFTALDERVCEICGPMHGTETEIDQPFLTVDQMADQGIENYDGEIDTANAHPQCRCVMIPKVK